MLRAGNTEAQDVVPVSGELSVQGWERLSLKSSGRPVTGPEDERASLPIEKVAGPWPSSSGG